MIKLPARRMRKPSECISEASETPSETTSRILNQQDLHEEFTNWKLAPPHGNVKTKPNAIGKLWKHVTKEVLPPFDEEDWLRKPGWFIDELTNKKLMIIRLFLDDPLISPIEKEIMHKMLKFLSNSFPHLQIHMCFNNIRDLTKEEKESIMKESHVNHSKERHTLEKARKLGIGLGMDKEIIDYMPTPENNWSKKPNGISHSRYSNNTS